MTKHDTHDDRVHTSILHYYCSGAHTKSRTILINIIISSCVSECYIYIYI